MKNIDNIEIMAPVGSFESLHAAINAGANSIYFGVGKLNMRARSASNFDYENLAEITSICRQNNVKTYLTVNTIIYDNELEEMRTLIDQAKKNKVSAIIASDVAVMEYAKSIGVKIHISTQANISSIEAIRFWAHYSDVMVTARELSLKQVYNIVQTIEKEQICGPSGELVRIEIFIHGALCMAVSGKCYMSLHNYNSSANRGACLQGCRHTYSVKDTDDGTELEIDNKYIMSPKDLCTIDFLDKIVNAGVSVLKIEGRGRSPEYVKKVVETYKEGLLNIKNGSFTLELTKNLKKELSKVYNRGFWDGYYLGRKMGEWTERYGSQAIQKKIYIGKISNYFTKISVAELKVETHSLSVGDKYFITGPTTGVLEGEIEEIRVDLRPVKSALKGETCSFVLDTFLRRGDKLYKVVEEEDEF